MSTIESTRQPVVDYIKAMLGDGMIDIELDPIHYSTAIDRAFAKYRQKSANSVEESFAFLTLEQDVNEWLLELLMGAQLLCMDILIIFKNTP